ncbi:IclR family transcriptional regulator [Novosphingobium endophyticum]|uniref:IclR family transcriptional regulator n=1 Tax=Novosphingobium endophyticum TaxID=1955250 RepID=A0A916TVQ8_9SPHN|nr:IclR family transcriptional regulator [Novosphingobium endophyticum]GGC12257.1 IclR family transcriptional regulator [Novosphingobium endophyticum]
MMNNDHPATKADGGRAAGTSTLDLALRVLEFLALASEPKALAEIAAEFAASKATIYRHLVTMQRHGFVRQDSRTGRYSAGIKLIVLGEAQRGRLDVVTAAHPHLIHLRDSTGQATTLSALVDDDLVVLELIEGRSIIDFSTRPGTKLALHASAHGKIWLAFGPLGLLESTVSSPLDSWTSATLTNPAALRREIGMVRSRGWASAPEEVMPGVNALSAPVFDHRSQLVAAVAIVGSTQAISARPNRELVEQVVACARTISLELGWQG